MVQSINKIHNDSTILNSNEGVKYWCNGTKWIRNDNIRLHRYINKTISETGLNPADLTNDDYVELSEKYNNNLLQSELLTDKIWKKSKNLVVTTTPDLFVFPDNANPCFNVRTPVTSSTIEEFYIEQQFVSNLNKTYIFSLYLKNIDTNVHSKAAISVKDLSYHTAASAAFDLNDENLHFVQDDSNPNLAYADLNIKYYKYTSTEYTEIEYITAKSYFENCSAGIERIVKNGKYYYRPYIKFKIKNNTNFSVGLNLLNDEYEYIYAPTTSVRFYTSGGQLEQYSKNVPTKAGPYMITYKTPVINIIQREIYKVSDNNWKKVKNKIYYLKSVKEIQDPDNITRKIISSSDPLIDNSNYDDVAVIQNVISFGTVSSNINKTYPEWSYLDNSNNPKYYKVGDKVIYMNNLYMSKTNHYTKRKFSDDILNWEIILDGVGLGFKELYNVPVDCVCYDKNSKTYKIFKNTTEGDQWLSLKVSGENVKNKAIVHAITYGQGRYQTWDEIADVKEPRYVLGFNSGGNYNFVKLSHISNYL